jgi:sulfite dehydrogenase (cytochrome) subunit A
MNRWRLFNFLEPLGAALMSLSDRMASVFAASSNTVDLARFPEKTEMILLADPLPQLETLLHYFRQDVTPNEAFFVRWYLEGIPTSELRSQFDSVSLVMLNQCSRNSRSFFEPRIPDGQWKNGAVRDAKWTGVPLKTVLDRAQVKAGAVDVGFKG